MFIHDRQKAHNADTRGHWEQFSAHRQHVTGLLCALARDRPARLGIFGAGNCNDLDLKSLAAAFDRIDLIDLDSDALQFALRNQAVGNENIVLHGEVDITGVADLMSEWRCGMPATKASAAACAARAATAVGRTQGMPAAFHVTASIGVLSQLVDGVISTLGETHPEFLKVMTAIRTRHLQILLEATEPGGTVLLGVDVVSSQTCPQILTAKPENLWPVLTEAVKTRNFFTGMNPFALHHLLKTEPRLAPQIAEVTAGRPWLWNLDVRSYAVVPFFITRTTTA